VAKGQSKKNQVSRCIGDGGKEERSSRTDVFAFDDVAI